MNTDFFMESRAAKNAAAIDNAMKVHAHQFGAVFGLRKFKGEFRISKAHSFVGDDGKVKLYVQKRTGTGGWSDWAKDDPRGVARQSVKLKKE